jgi:probable F420-dependent oxidoreductase
VIRNLQKGIFMKIGAVYPQIELHGDPQALDQIGRSVESLSYDHLLMFDHVVGAAHENRNPPLWGPYTDKDPFHDPMVAFGYLAGITQRIELVTGVLILPQRQTALVAKQAAEVDLLSGGRLRLGVGSGWNYVEYDALGQDFESRGPRLSEQIVLLRRLWSEPLLTFEGSFDRIDRANIVPRPNRRIPIYCGGFSEPAYRRAAKLADGFIFAGSLAKRALPGWDRIQQHLVEEGRPVAEFGRHLIVQNDRGCGYKVDDAVDILRQWQDAGGTHASITTMGLGYSSVEQHINHLAKVQQGLGRA